jgi:hypothetical protein
VDWQTVVSSGCHSDDSGDIYAIRRLQHRERETGRQKERARQKAQWQAQHPCIKSSARASASVPSTNATHIKHLAHQHNQNPQPQRMTTHASPHSIQLSIPSTSSSTIKTQPQRMTSHTSPHSINSTPAITNETHQAAQSKPTTTTHDCTHETPLNQQSGHHKHKRNASSTNQNPQPQRMTTHVTTHSTVRPSESHRPFPRARAPPPSAARCCPGRQPHPPPGRPGSPRATAPSPCRLPWRRRETALHSTCTAHKRKYNHIISIARGENNKKNQSKIN